MQNRGSVWKVYVGRRWYRIHRKGRRWYVRYKKRLRPLPRNPRTFQIRLRKGYRSLRRIGKRYLVKVAKRYRPMRRRFTWFAKYKGRRVLVKRKGRLGFVRWRGKWLRGRRLRYRRPTRRGTDMNSEYSFLWSMAIFSPYQPSRGSVRENVDLGRVHRTRCVWSVLTTAIKILPYTDRLSSVNKMLIRRQTRILIRLV